MRFFIVFIVSLLIAFPAHSKKNKKLGITEKEYNRIMRTYHEVCSYFDEYEFYGMSRDAAAKWCSDVASIMRRTGHLKSLHPPRTHKYKSRKNSRYRKSRKSR